MANRNRSAGNGFEREIANELKELGFGQVVTTRAESRNMDAKGIDLMGDDLPFFIQCKTYTTNPNYHTLLTNPLLPKDKPTFLVHKKTEKAKVNFVNKGEYVIMKKADFYNLIKNN